MITHSSLQCKVLFIVVLFKPLKIFEWSQRIEPSQQIRVALPSRRFGGTQFGIHLFQRPPLCFKAGLGAMVGSIEVDLAQPASDHRDVDSRGNRMYGCGMSKDVGRNPFLCRGRRLLAAATYGGKISRATTGRSSRLPCILRFYRHFRTRTSLALTARPFAGFGSETAGGQAG